MPTIKKESETVRGDPIRKLPYFLQDKQIEYLSDIAHWLESEIVPTGRDGAKYMALFLHDLARALRKEHIAQD